MIHPHNLESSLQPPIINGANCGKRNSGPSLMSFHLCVIGWNKDCADGSPGSDQRTLVYGIFAIRK